MDRGSRLAVCIQIIILNAKFISFKMQIHQIQFKSLPGPRSRCRPWYSYVPGSEKSPGNLREESIKWSKMELQRSSKGAKMELTTGAPAPVVGGAEDRCEDWCGGLEVDKVCPFLPVEVGVRVDYRTQAMCQRSSRKSSCGGDCVCVCLQL